MRIRSLCPDQWRRSRWVQVSPLARLLDLGLRNLADDQGVLPWDPLHYRISILPADDCSVDALLDELVAAELLFRYATDGEDYAALRYFGDDQHPQKPQRVHPLPANSPKGFAGADVAGVQDRSGTGTIPVRDQYDTGTVAIPDRIGSDRIGSNTDLDHPGVIESPPKTIPMKKTNPNNYTKDAVLLDFGRFWAAYPHKVAKAAASKVWEKLRPDRVLTDAILAGLERAKRTDNWRNDGGKYIPYGASWLNGRRWEDEPAEASGGNGESPDLKLLRLKGLPAAAKTARVVS